MIIADTDVLIHFLAGREPAAARASIELEKRSSDRAASVRRALEDRGEGIGMADSLIAGIVLANDGILLTRNRRPFARVDGLSLASLGTSA